MVKEKDNQKKEKPFAAILSLISEGYSVRAACRMSGMNETTFRMTVDPTQYARSRDLCADVHFDGLLDLAEKVEQGVIDPQAARVSADIKKWNLARMKPKSYGDRLPVETDNKNVGESILSAITEALKK